MTFSEESALLPSSSIQFQPIIAEEDPKIVAQDLESVARDLKSLARDFKCCRSDFVSYDWLKLDG